LIRYGKLLPHFSGKYIEPFLGGASVFFYIARRERRPCQAVLGDLNRELIKTFQGVQQDPSAVHLRLEHLQEEYARSRDKAEFYYRLRDSFNSSQPRVDPAVFIFLNKTCWNGLYRVNQSGRFNVPHGAQRTPHVIPSLEELSAASSALQQARLRATSWENLLSLAEEGDFVFLDPPYFSDLEQDDIKYRSSSFAIEEHSKLAEYARGLAARRILFVLTSSGEPEMENLYARNELRVKRVSVPRSISSKTDGRSAVEELIVTPSWLRLGESV
jgi:DNA adenine methylase